MGLCLKLYDDGMIQLTTGAGEEIFLTLLDTGSKAARLRISAPQSVVIRRHQRTDVPARPERKDRR